MTKEAALLELISELNQIDTSIECELMSTFNNINSINIRIKYINEKIQDTFIKYNFKIINISPVIVKKTLFVTLTYINPIDSIKGQP